MECRSLNTVSNNLSEDIRFDGVDWNFAPANPGTYVILDNDEIVYVGMAGRNGKGSLRNRLKDHASGQIVNMFAQYLFLTRAQFLYENENRIDHPREAQTACRNYIKERCSFQFLATDDAAGARDLEKRLKAELNPALNPLP